MCMILIITLIISGLVAINVLLLKFSCNKINRSTKSSKKPIFLKTRNTIPLTPKDLALTGS